MVSEVLKFCKKSYLLMYIKAKVKKPKPNYKSYLQNLRYNVKQACTLDLNLFCIPLSLILSYKNMRGGYVSSIIISNAVTN